MRRTASEIIEDLEIRIAHLERQALDKRDVLTRRLKRNVRELNDLAEKYLIIAIDRGFINAKIQEHQGFPVVVLQRGTYVFFKPMGYTWEHRGSSSEEVRWQNIIFRLNELSELQKRRREEEGVGGRETLMTTLQITPSTTDVLQLLKANGGFMGEKWMLASETGNVASFTTGSGDYSLSVKLAPKTLGFSLTGLFANPRKPGISTLNGRVRGGSRKAQLLGLAERLDREATRMGKTLGKSRARTLRALGML